MIWGGKMNEADKETPPDGRRSRKKSRTYVVRVKVSKSPDSTASSVRREQVVFEHANIAVSDAPEVRDLMFRQKMDAVIFGMSTALDLSGLRALSILPRVSASEALRRDAEMVNRDTQVAVRKILQATRESSDYQVKNPPLIHEFVGPGQR